MGRSIYWTEERILELIKDRKFQSVADWRRESTQSCRVAKRSDAFFAKCEKLIAQNYPRGRKQYWTPDLCIKEAQRFCSRTEWHDMSSQSFRFAKNDDDLFAKCTVHMDVKVNEWTLEAVVEKAKLYGSARKWSEACSGSYKAACQNEKWRLECKKHLKPKAVRRTLIDCQEIAKKYATRSEWQKSERASYMTAYRNGWLDQCIS